MSKRIDKLEVGALVRLRFRYSAEAEAEDAVFLGVTGEGEDRRARFAQGVLKNGGSVNGLFVWEAYRYGGRWVYGTSADPLSVVAVVDDFGVHD